MKGLFTKSCALAVVCLGALTAMNSENDFANEKMSKRYMKTHQDRFTCDIDEARGYAHYERVEGRKGLKVNLDERGSILSIRANGVNDPHKASLFALGYVDKAHKSQQKIAKGFPRVKFVEEGAMDKLRSQIEILTEENAVLKKQLTAPSAEEIVAEVLANN